MKNSANFRLARRQLTALSPSAPILSYAQSCPVELASNAANTAIGGHGIGLDFINTTNMAVKTSSFTSVSGNIILFW